MHTVKLCLEKSDWAHFCGKTTIILIFNLIFAQNLIPFFFQALFLKFCILEGHYVWKKSGNALFLEKTTIVLIWVIFTLIWAQELVHFVLHINCNCFSEILCGNGIPELSKTDSSEYLEKLFCCLKNGIFNPYLDTCFFAIFSKSGLTIFLKWAQWYVTMSK